MSFKDQLDELSFVMITAQGTVDTAVSAMKEGAYDYLTKPIDPQRLRVLLERMVERHDSRREMAALRRQLVNGARFGRMIGASPAILEVYKMVEQAAPSEATVLIWGESGTGKELMARTIHDLSPRSSAPFVALNCAAIPDGLLESEIFGHERGAFTGAVERRHGCFELAYQGTVLLDEVTEMAPALQAKLLRVLQERTVRRLGGGSRAPHRRPDRGRDQPRPQGSRQGRPLTRGPVLPNQRHDDRDASAEKASRGYSVVDSGLPDGVQPA